MRLPTATYRLQFRGEMDFDRAIVLLPYLDTLGVSHLYADCPHGVVRFQC